MVLRPGTTFAGYTVIAPLGAGGMGQVYLVEHPRLQRRQALKVISLAGAGNDEFQRRFTNEARTAASLDHPNIITIHDFGVTDDTPWFSMSYLDGDDLASTRLTDTEVLAVITQVADALDYAHHHDVIHRDIKPANIVVTRTPSKALHRVVVLDFGIAKLANGVHTSLTATNALIGTLAYCAPEIIDGKGASPRSDQYALACTAYQLLTGTTPFVADGAPAMMMAHLGKEPTPVSVHRPDLAALDAVFATALAKNPDHRYLTCSALATTLVRALTSPDEDGQTIRSPRAATITELITAPPPMPISGPGEKPASLTNVRTEGALPAEPVPPRSPHASGGAEQYVPTRAAPIPGTAHAKPPQVFPQPIRTWRGPRHHRGFGRRVWIGAGILAVVTVAAISTVVVLNTADSPTDVRALSTGSVSSCSLTEHFVHCWGGNSDGQLGDGTTTSRTTPTKVTGITESTRVATSGTSACAITNGTVYCWGRNDFGQLGDGSTTSRHTPTKVSGLTRVSAIAVGDSSTCAIADGEVYCWGSNLSGQLGDGTTTSRHSPSQVPGLTNATDIATSGASTCAIADSNVYCWGGNSFGQLGDGTNTSRSSPTRVKGLTTASDIAVGISSSCAVSDAIAYCWGSNSYGQLGDGTTTDRPTATQVVSLTGVDALSTSAGTTCAIADHTAYCWGNNRAGQIGNGTTTNRSSPTKVRNLSDVTTVSTGGNTTCAIADNTAYCWGNNPYGQLGDGTTTNRTTPTKVIAPA